MLEWLFITGLTVCLDSPTPRCELTLQQLLAQQVTAVDLFHFQPTIERVPAAHALEGRITIRSMDLFRAVGGRSAGVGPRATFDVFTVGDRLVPVQRGRILRDPDHPARDLIVDPGWVWTEASDNGLSRAVLPFTWTGRTYNDSHNGLLTLLYDDTGIHAARAQVMQENQLGARTDLTALAELDYRPGLADVETLESDYLAEAAAQPQHRPLAALGSGLPEVLTQVGAPGNLSVAAVYRDGILYRSACPTARGEHPWCRSERHGAYSVSKSLAGAMTLFWLAQEYGEWVLDERIVDHVEVTANHDGWQQVRFRDVINMATGVGTNAPDAGVRDMYADENDVRINGYFLALSRADKLRAAFAYDDYPWGPGEVVRYNTAQTFVLSSAIENLVRTVEGAEADYWDLLNERVFSRLGMGYIDIQRTREPDGSRGTPYLGTGLFLNVDQTARLGALIAAEGAWEGQQLLHRPSIRAALYRDEVGQLQRGTTRPDGESRYHFSFFSEPLQTSRCRAEVPFMVGYGGNVVALGDDGTVVMTYSDGGIFNHRAQAELLGSLDALCFD